MSGDPPARASHQLLIDVVAKRLSAEDRVWLLSNDGLVAACRDAVARRDLAVIDAIDSSDLWSQVVDLSPHPLGLALARRGRAILAVTRAACGAADGPLGAHGIDPIAAAELRNWLTTPQWPSPMAVRRVTFLVDEHTRGRAVRLTLSHRPDAVSFAQDLVANPFTVVDESFQAALDDARLACDEAVDGVRWSVMWEDGEVPLELRGRSVGLAALVCFDRLRRGDQLAVERSWAFTGSVDRRGRVTGCIADAGDGSFANKLRAAERRPVMVAPDDLERAMRIADAGNLPVRLHAVTGLDDVVALLDRRKPPWLAGDMAPTFGRAPQLDTFTEITARTVAEGGPSVVCVTGEPGIGKSRLARDAASMMAGRGWLVAWGACFEAEATAAYRPAVAVVRSLLDCFDDQQTVVGDDVDDLAVLMPDVIGRRGRARRVAAGSDRQLAMFDAVARTIGRAADMHPILLVVEDVHWADRPSLLLLAHVLRHCPRLPVMVLVTYRDYDVRAEHPVSSWLAEARATARVDEIHLDGLDEATVDAMLTELNGRQAPASFVSAMTHVTQGNPLFVHELVRHVRSSGVIDPRRGVWNVRLDDIALPSGLRNVLATRVRTLSRRTQELLRFLAASPAGVTFDVLRHASEMDQPTVLDALDQAIDAGVVHELRRDDVGVVFEFRHVLFRYALAEQSSAARRATYHLALARALAAQVGPEDQWTGEIGYHLHSAGRQGDPQAALVACQRAGELAMARTAYDDAVTQFERAIEAAGWTRAGSSMMVAQLELAAAEASHRAGDQLARRALSERAFDHAGRSGDAVTAARAALVHGGARSTYGVPSHLTMTMLEQALVLLDSDDDLRDVRARVVSRLAQETYHIQRFAEAKRMSADSILLLSAGSSAADRAAVLDGRAWTLHTPDDCLSRLELADEMVRDAIHAGDAEWEMSGRSWRCTALLELGDVAGIDEELRRLDALAIAAPVPSHLFRVATLRCTRAMMAGAFDEGARLADEAYRIGTPIEPENALQTLCAQLLGMLREQDLLIGLVDTAEQMVADFPMVPGWRCALAVVNLEAGRPARAHELFDELRADGFSGLPRDLAWLRAHAYLAELAAAFGDEGAAARLYRLLRPYEGRNVGLYDISSGGAVDHYLGVLATTTDRRTAAIRHLRRAVTFNDRTAQRPAAARSRLALAAVLSRGSDRERQQALALAQQADHTVRALGLVSLGRQVTELGATLSS